MIALSEEVRSNPFFLAATGHFARVIRIIELDCDGHWVLHPQNAIYWHWEMQNWLARYIGGKPTLEKPTFKTDDVKPDDAKKDATKPADL